VSRNSIAKKYNLCGNKAYWADPPFASEPKRKPKSKFRLTAIRAASEQTLKRPHVSQQSNTSKHTQLRPLYLVMMPVLNVQKTSLEILLLVLGSRDQTCGPDHNQKKRLRLKFAPRAPQIVDGGRSQNRINCDGASEGSICDPLRADSLVSE
jgi:hypothetical protein